MPRYRCGGFASLIPLLQKKCCIAAFRFTSSQKEEWKNAHAIENAFAAFSSPLFFVQTLSSRAASCHPDRAKRVEGSAALGLLSSKKEEWKNAHANKNAFAAFPIPLSLSNASSSRRLFHLERQSVVLSAVERPVLPVVFLSPRAAVERSVRKGRFLGSGPSDLRSE